MCVVGMFAHLDPPLQLSLLYFTTAVTVSFSQSTYSVNEDAGPAQPVLVLSNPPSTDTSVHMSTSDITATGKESTDSSKVEYYITTLGLNANIIDMKQSLLPTIKCICIHARI